MVEDSLKSQNFSGAPPLFCEVQYFRSNKAMYFVYLALFGACVAIIFEVKKLKEKGIVPYALFFALFVILFILFVLNIVKLKIEVGISELTFSMFPLMLQAKRYKLSEIEKAEPVIYRPIVDFGGWGIRYGKKGMWAYNVYGNKGVIVSLKSGKKFLLGTQKPEELARSIMKPL